MNVFVPFASAMETALCLDSRRRNKQIIECSWIIDAVNGVTKPRSWHPIYDMYRDYLTWLGFYQTCLKLGKEGYSAALVDADTKARMFRPDFLEEQWFLNNMKSRLYTKAPDLYPQFAKYGTSNANFYLINGTWWKYEQGTKTEYSPC